MEKIKIQQATKAGTIECEIGGAFDMSYPNSKTRRGRVQDNGNVSPTLTATNMEIGIVEPVIGALRGRNPDDPTDRTAGIPTQQRLEIKNDGTSNTLTTVQKDKLICEPIALDEQNHCLRNDGTVGTLTTYGSSPKHNNRVIEPTERFYQQALKTAQENDCDNGDIIDAYNGKVNKDGVSPTVTTRPEGFKTAILPIQDYRIRKLTPRECWRLMGFSDDDFTRAKYGGDVPIELYHKMENRVCNRFEWKQLYRVIRRQYTSDSQLYKQAGNSIVCTVLEEIFKKML